MALVLWAWVAVCAFAGLPVESVHYTVDVHGPIAEVRVHQVFRNDSPDTIEGTYVFPLHEGAAVDGMEIRVGDRTVEGIVLEAQQATETYERALADGYVAALTTQQRPNVFTQQVGNIPPGERIVVTLRTVQPVPHTDGAYELVIPLVVGPRFEPAQSSPSTGMPAERPAPQSPIAVSTPTRAQLDVVVHAPTPIRWFESPSHAISTRALDGNTRLLSERVPLDRDFVLRWDLAGAETATGAIVQDGHVLLTFEPPKDAPRNDIVPRELVFVVDQSGSMGGRPIELARAAMLSALDQVDARDSVRVLRFANRVEGDAGARPATPDVLASARAQIRGMQASGGTYLLDGVIVALAPPPDPRRERTVVFMTDGLIGNDLRVLGEISDRVGNARLFAFGVGPAPNRWLLDEMARFGGGRTTWLRDGEDPTAAVRRFVDSVSRPVLTDIAIDWGDWVVDEVWPERISAMYVGQPMRVVGRVLHRGTTPITVRGRIGDRPFSQTIEAVTAEPGRAIPSTWAREKIANLERDQVWGEIPEVRDAILETSLGYQVMSQYTAFVAVDRSRIVNPGGPDRSVEQTLEVPDGAFGSVEDVGGVVASVEVINRLHPFDVQSTSAGVVLTRETITRLPTGRSYQGVISLAAGVPGQGGNRNIGGGATNENTYMLDGANITDPVTSTFSINFNFDALAQVDVLFGGYMPEHAGAGPLVEATTRSGTNNLDASAGFDHVQGIDAPHRQEHATADVSGPIVRDRVWALATAEVKDSAIGGRSWFGGAGFLKLTAQPTTKHRLSLSGATSPWTLDAGGERIDDLGGLGQLRWQVFPTSDLTIDSVASVSARDLSGDRRSRMSVGTDVSAWSLEDGVGGRHDLKAGVEGERIAWDPQGPISSALVPGATAATELRLSAFAQDSWRPWSRFTVNGGARLDVAFARPHWGPRLFAAWDPWGDQRTNIGGGVARSWGEIGLLSAQVDPGDALSRRDELIGLVSRELVRDLTLRLDVVGSARRDLPTTTGRADADTVCVTATLEKRQAYRWNARLAYARTWALSAAPSGSLLSADGVAFTHHGTAKFGWDLPTDPWPTMVGAVADLDAEPLFPQATVAGTSPALAHASWGVAVAQTFDLRRGKLVLDAELRDLVLFGDPGPIDALAWPTDPLPDSPGTAGLAVRGGLRFEL